jgi:hypothetical protein
MMITKRILDRNLSVLLRRAFSSSQQQPNTTTDEEGFDSVRARIDPVKGQVTDFLKHVSIYEEQNLDVESPYFMEQARLQGHATQVGTDKYYRRS